MQIKIHNPRSPQEKQSQRLPSQRLPEPSVARLGQPPTNTPEGTYGDVGMPVRDANMNNNVSNMNNMKGQSPTVIAANTISNTNRTLTKAGDVKQKVLGLRLTRLQKTNGTRQQLQSGLLEQLLLTILILHFIKPSLLEQ